MLIITPMVLLTPQNLGTLLLSVPDTSFPTTSKLLRYL
ncbi:hypothetical protein Gotur_030980 [Gossypium turneri]